MARNCAKLSATQPVRVLPRAGHDLRSTRRRRNALPHVPRPHAARSDGLQRGGLLHLRELWNGMVSPLAERTARRPPLSAFGNCPHRGGRRAALRVAAATAGTGSPVLRIARSADAPTRPDALIVRPLSPFPLPRICHMGSFTTDAAHVNDPVPSFTGAAEANCQADTDSAGAGLHDVRLRRSPRLPPPHANARHR
jgi:hypothetical protein